MWAVRAFVVKTLSGHSTHTHTHTRTHCGPWYFSIMLWCFEMRCQAWLARPVLPMRAMLFCFCVSVSHSLPLSLSLSLSPSLSLFLSLSVSHIHSLIHSPPIHSLMLSLPSSLGLAVYSKQNGIWHICRDRWTATKLQRCEQMPVRSLQIGGHLVMTVLIWGSFIDR